MDIARELLAIHRCLRAPAFRARSVVRDGSGRMGTVIAARLSVLENGVGNEFEVRWEDGQIDWVDGRLLTPANGNGFCAS